MYCSEWGSNLGRKLPMHFKSNALTTRPSELMKQCHCLKKTFVTHLILCVYLTVDMFPYISVLMEEFKIQLFLPTFPYYKKVWIINKNQSINQFKYNYSRQVFRITKKYEGKMHKNFTAPSGDRTDAGSLQCISSLTP